MSVYIITGTSGDYSERRDWNIAVLHDEQLAEKIRNDLNELTLFNNKFVSKIRTEFDSGYKKGPQAPERPTPSEEYTSLAKACSGAIGKAAAIDTLKQAFRKVQAEHIARIRSWETQYHAYSDKLRAHLNDMENARLVWTNANYDPPEHLKYILTHNILKEEVNISYHSDTAFNYESCSQITVI